MHIKPTHKKMRMLHSSQLKKHTEVFVFLQNNDLTLWLPVYKYIVLIMKITANENDINDTLQMFR